MTAGKQDDKRPDPGRHVYGPRPVAALLPPLLRPAFRRRSPAGARILSDWEAIIGPALAAVTLPRRLVGGTLTIACSGPVAMELTHLADQLTARINQYLGSTAVQRLRFLQEPFAPPAVTPPRPDATLRAQAAVGDLPPGPLRDALLRLGSAVLGATS